MHRLPTLAANPELPIDERQGHTDAIHYELDGRDPRGLDFVLAAFEAPRRVAEEFEALPDDDQQVATDQRELERDANIRATGMLSKLFEIRDDGTFIPVLAVRLGSQVEAERFLADRGGFGETPEAQGRYVVLVQLCSMRAQHDPHAWRSRTMTTAHFHIATEFDRLEAGQVIDVEYLLGETEEPKQTEAG